MGRGNEGEAWIVAGEETRSHAAIEERARRGASGLAALGIGAGDVVALLLHNDIAVFEAQRAAALLGAVAVQLDRHMADSDLRFALGDCAARVMIAHADLLRGRSLSLRVVICPTPNFVNPAASEPCPDDLVWDDWLAAEKPLAGGGTAPTFALSTTSGSTGRPKIVRRARGPRSDGSSKARQVYGFDAPGPAVALVTGPLSHSVPRAFARLAQDAGADIVLMARFEAAEALALIARHGVTHVHFSPAMMLRMLRLPEDLRRRHSWGSLRHVVHGAAHCSKALKAEAIATWGPIVHEYYGSTETGLLTLADSADAARRPGTVGRALPGIALAVLDPDGYPVPAGAAGTVYASSASLHRFSYLGRTADRTAIGGGDLVTAGDVGHLDAEGYLFLHDRGRDLVCVCGEIVVPARIEAAILGLPGVADCAVLDTPGEDGPEVSAFIEPLPGAEISAAEITAQLAATPGPRPDRIEIVDRLPRSDSGKIFKQVLRAAFAGQRPEK